MRNVGQDLPSRYRRPALKGVERAADVTSFDLEADHELTKFFSDIFMLSCKMIPLALIDSLLLFLPCYAHFMRKLFLFMRKVSSPPTKKGS